LFGDAVKEFRDFLTLMLRYDPSFLRTPVNRRLLPEGIHRIVEIINHNAEAFGEDFSLEYLDSQISNMSTLIEIIDVEGKPDPWDSNPDFEKARELLSTRLEHLESAWADLERARDEAQEHEEADRYTSVDEERWRAGEFAPVPTVDDRFPDL
jgi:hypothetical protein